MGRKTPSPATVISIIALVLAVAGTAVATVATVSVLSKKEKKQTRNIAKNEIKKAAPGLSVANAAQLGGKPAADYLLARSRGAALAGAEVSSDGTVETWFNTFGAAPTVGSCGTVCFDVTFPGASNLNQAVIQGTIASGAGEILVDQESDGTSALVQTFNSSGAPFAHRFFVVVYGASSSG